MYWSFSEYLNLIELRSQTWCVLDIAEANGIRLPHSETVLFHAVLEGSARLSFGAKEPRLMTEGDVAIITSGEAHALRPRGNGVASVLPFLRDSGYADAPVTIAVGKGDVACRLLCGRLKPRWPGAKRPGGMPALLTSTAAESGVDIARLLASARDGGGGAATLTHMASLIFIERFRSHPAAAAIFRDSSLREPIAEAVQLIQTHPFREWTVGLLARKVGMGRSNFATRFAVDVGKTPIALLTEERMKCAEGMLYQTDLKVADIAERVGYRSESAFSHRFQSHFGMTPGELRHRRRLPSPAMASAS